VTDADPLCAIAQGVDEPVVDAFLYENPVGGDAGLAGIPELADLDAVQGRLDIGVIEDDECGVSTEFEADLRQVAGTIAHQLFADDSGTGKADLADQWAVYQCLSDSGSVFPGAGDDVEHPFRDAGRFAKRCNREGRERRGFGRFEDHAVSRGEGRCGLARDHGRREIPGCNAADDPERMSRDENSGIVAVRRNDVAIKPAAFFSEPGEETCGIFDFNPGFADRLALFQGQKPCQVFRMIAYRCRPGVQHQGPVA